MKKIEQFLSRCLLVLLVILSVSLFVVVSQNEIAKDQKRLDKSYERLERAEDRRVESIVNS